MPRPHRPPPQRAETRSPEPGADHNSHWEEHFDSRARYYFEQTDLMDDSQLNGGAADIADQQHGGWPVERLPRGSPADLGCRVPARPSWSTAAASRTAAWMRARAPSTCKTSSALGIWPPDALGRLDHHETYGNEFSPVPTPLYSLSDEWVIKGAPARRSRPRPWPSPAKGSPPPPAAAPAR